ncbi:adenylate cyclase [Naegleria gruberi]|uniref:Adenylate cyclase n=1 Tax=Naegleria gruberi TaxID=5762 RepID=D2W1A6_NAEGR|nr:adenylate cyclase [Naegleria gruberi]EFC37151.1 adenylate cyclase [Naegleria gruberi]|eukprot:XP_002669895.1 adenylate cyclase [Naegleria gruberi strain NEG-M]
MESYCSLDEDKMMMYSKKPDNSNDNDNSTGTQTSSNCGCIENNNNDEEVEQQHADQQQQQQKIDNDELLMEMILNNILPINDSSDDSITAISSSSAKLLSNNYYNTESNNNLSTEEEPSSSTMEEEQATLLADEESANYNIISDSCSTTSSNNSNNTTCSTSTNYNHHKQQHDDKDDNMQCKYNERQRRALALLMAIRDKYEKNLEKSSKITTTSGGSLYSSKRMSSTRITTNTSTTAACSSFKTMLKLALVLIVGVWCVLSFMSDVIILDDYAASGFHHRYEYLEDDFYEFNHNNIMFVMAEPPGISPQALKEILSRESEIMRQEPIYNDFSFSSLFSMNGLHSLASKATDFLQRGGFESSADVATQCLINSPRKCDNSRKLQLIQFNWLGPTVNANVAKIVLEEMLGICAEIVTMNVTHALEEMAEYGTRRSYAMLEFWSESRKFQYDKYVVNDKTIMDVGELGINAKLGWYILGFMKDEYDLIDEYREYRTEKAAHYLATNDTYPLGRFIGGAKSWITFDQQIITNLKLNLQIQYTQEENAEDFLISKIQEANDRKEPVLFYLWYPHQIFKKLSIKNVYLPPSSESCWTSYNQENQLIDCDYPTELLRKLVSPKLTEDMVLNSFFSKFAYESTDQIDILADIVFQEMSVVDASCKWLRNNTKRVAYWVSDHNDTSSSVIGIVIASLFVISLFFCTIFITGLVLYFMYRKNLRKRSLKYAPRTTPFTLVFTDIQNSTLLWATASETMKSVLSIHNIIMRSNIQKYKGYEAKTAGDSFTVAFVDPLCALAFCISVQKDLLLANWPSDSLLLPDMKEVRWNESLIYRGPRIRMGIHAGSDCNIQIDKKTQRMEYVGNMVHIANKIEASSVGGRIYVSGAFVQAIKSRLMLFDSASNSSNPKTSKEDVTTSANTQYYDDSSDKGISKYVQELNNNLIEFEDLGPKQEIEIGGTKIPLFMVKDFSFARTSWIQQFERVLEESPVEEQKVIGQKLDLIEEVEKFITDPGSFPAERKSKLIYDFINHTSDAELNLPSWNSKYFIDLFDNVFRYITTQHVNIKEE